MSEIVFWLTPCIFVFSFLTQHMSELNFLILTNTSLMYLLCYYANQYVLCIFLFLNYLYKSENWVLPRILVETSAMKPKKSKNQNSIKCKYFIIFATGVEIIRKNLSITFSKPVLLYIDLCRRRRGSERSKSHY